MTIKLDSCAIWVQLESAYESPTNRIIHCMLQISSYYSANVIIEQRLSIQVHILLIFLQIIRHVRIEYKV